MSFPQFQFDGVVSLDEIPGEPEIVAAGPLYKQSGTMAYRVILARWRHGSWVVRNELFKDWPNLDKSSGGQGEYFHGGDALERAMRAFGIRITKMADYKPEPYPTEPEPT